MGTQGLTQFFFYKFLKENSRPHWCSTPPNILEKICSREKFKKNLRKVKTHFRMVAKTVEWLITQKRKRANSHFSVHKISNRNLKSNKSNSLSANIADCSIENSTN